jgi:3-oxoadipate enol-lactonase
MTFFNLKDGTKIFYKEEGKGAPPILLVHGWTMDSWLWQFQMPFLSKYYRTVALDLKGAGSSDKPQTRYGTQQFTSEVDQLCDKLFAKEPFVLCCHSFGGYIGLTYATDTRLSKKLKGLVLCHTQYVAKGNPAIKALLDGLKKGVFGPRRSFADMFSKLAFNSKFIREHKDLVQTWIDETMKCPDYVAQSWMESVVDDYDITQKLGQINVPVLIITSDTDGQQDPKQSYYMKEHIKNSQLSVIKPQVGHHSMLELPDEFNKTVKAFIEKL